MIKEIFLSCALALPPAHLEMYREYKLLAEIAKDNHAEKILIRWGVHAVPKNTIKLPLKWRGFTVYLLRSS